MEATLRLFNALLVDNHTPGECTAEQMASMISEGFILAPDVMRQYSDRLDEVIEDVAKIIGLSTRKINSTLHKSWEKVMEGSMLELIVDQILHYITTYGLERIDAYSPDTIYIPDEALDLPDSTIGDLHLIVVKGCTQDELRIKLLDMLKSGIALSDQTVADVVSVSIAARITADDLPSIANREVRALLCKSLGLVPEDPVEFMRTIVQAATGAPLIVKDARTIRALALTNAEHMLTEYEMLYGLERLAETFYRLKPLWLALRNTRRSKRIVNRIRKLARKHHKPMRLSTLDSVTPSIRRGTFNAQRVRGALGKANIYRKIRLANALRYRLWGRHEGSREYVVYQIRNGKGFATRRETLPIPHTHEAYDIVAEALRQDLEHLRGKKIFIPKYISYAAPISEKQYIGNIPAGTTVRIDEDLVFGIYWEDVGTHRIDLDLSVTRAGMKIGWDAAWRGDVTFSGDMTAAPNGATELMHVAKHDALWLANVNYFNYCRDIEVPMSIIVAQIPPEKVRRSHGYMVLPEELRLRANTVISTKHMSIGIVDAAASEFHLVKTSVFNGISARNTESTECARKYFRERARTILRIESMLIDVGAVLVEDPRDADIDLSPAKLEKDTFTMLLEGSNE